QSATHRSGDSINRLGHGRAYSATGCAYHRIADPLALAGDRLHGAKGGTLSGISRDRARERQSTSSGAPECNTWTDQLRQRAAHAPGKASTGIHERLVNTTLLGDILADLFA